MLLKIDLFNLVSSTSLDAFIDFDHQVTDRYSEVARTFGKDYLGVFQPEGMPKYRVAELNLIDAATSDEAAARRNATALPEDYQKIVAECNGYQEQDGLELWLSPAVPSPLFETRLGLEGNLIRVALYHPEPAKTYSDFERFERRITARYTEFMGQIGWRYLGVFHVQGMPEAMRADLYVIEGTSSVEEAIARDEATPAPQDIEEIVTECRTFMAPARERTNIWLRLLSLSASAKAGLMLSGVAGAHSVG